MLDVSIDDEDPSQALKEAFSALAASRVARICVRFSARTPADHRLAHALRRHLETTPSVRGIVLEHPDPAIGFVASSLSLWLPNISVEGRAPTSKGSTDARDAADEVAICQVRNQDGRDTIVAAFDSAETDRSRALVLAFDPVERVDRRLLDAVADSVLVGTCIRRIVLVHPSPGIGFLASGVALRCPTVRVVAAATVAEALRVLESG